MGNSRYLFEHYESPTHKSLTSESNFLGGGSNFGVVTEFTYQGHHHSGPVYSGTLVFKPDQLEALVETVKKWYKIDGQNPKTLLLLLLGSPPPEFRPTLGAVVFYDGSETEGRHIFKPFFELNPVQDLTNAHSYVEQVCISNKFTNPYPNGFLTL